MQRGRAALVWGSAIAAVAVAAERTSALRLWGSGSDVVDGLVLLVRAPVDVGVGNPSPLAAALCLWGYFVALSFGACALWTSCRGWKRLLRVGGFGSLVLVLHLACLFVEVKRMAEAYEHWRQRSEPRIGGP